MKRRLALTLLLVLTAWAPLSLSHADGDWPLRAVSQQGALSPDYRFVAYRFMPAAFTQALAELKTRVQGIAGMTNAYDIGITDLESGVETVIAGQPADTSYFVPNVPDNYRTRSNPEWSPNGTQVAWTSNEEDVAVPAGALTIGTGGFHLVVYDVAAQQMSIIATGLDQAEMIAVIGPDLIWTEAGISLLYNNDFHREVITVSPEGALVSQVTLNEPVDQYLPIQQDGQPLIAAKSSMGGWMVIDPRAGTWEYAEGVPVMYSVLASDTSLGIYSRERPDGILNRYIALPDGTSQRVYFVPRAISPDGTQIAYQHGTNEALAWSIGQPDQPLEFPGSGKWVWGPTAWRMMSGVSGEEVMPSEMQAQITPSPLLMKMAGDLFAWKVGDETPTRLTYRGDVGPAVVSPDGSRAVFQTNAGSQTYREIWQVDLNTFETIPLIELAETGVEAERVSPTWSPDGSQIAFLELTPAGEQRLVVYTLGTDTYQVIVSALPSPNTVFDMWAVWSEQGIAVVYSLPDSGGHEVRIYQPDGTLVSSATFSEAEIKSLFTVIWVSTPDGPIMLDLIHDGGSALVDPATGDKTNYEGDLWIYAKTTGAASVSARWAGGRWYAHQQDGREDPLGFALSEFRMFAPSGQEFAYSQYGKVLIWRDGQVMQVPPTGLEYSGEMPFVAWKSVQFGLGESRMTPPQEAPSECENAPAPRLQVGQPARVVAGQGANNVRATPGKDGELVGQIPEGEQFTVIEGPKCVENMFWWHVNYDGLNGWTAEGDSNAYWLEPSAG